VESNEELQKRKDDFKKSVTKSKEVDKVDFARQIATRAKLERDYKEDLINVTYFTSPGVERTVIARRPTPEEFCEMLNLAIQATKAEKNPDDVTSLEELISIYQDRFPKLATKITIDKTLNEEFWKKNVSVMSLSNFINSLMNASQQMSIGGVTKTEMEKFR